MTKGLRSEEKTVDEEHLTCCAKHFAAYGLAQAGQDYMPVDVSTTELYNTYLPPFKAALDAGCDMIMPAFTPVEREPAVISSLLMNDILRGQWAWEGVTISDWNAPEELIVHGVAANGAEAAERCMKAQLDIDMMSMTYLRNLTALIENGKISMKAIDRACLRILQLKNRMGLFERNWEKWTAKRQT